MRSNYYVFTLYTECADLIRYTRGNNDSLIKPLVNHVTCVKSEMTGPAASPYELMVQLMSTLTSAI